MAARDDAEFIDYVRSSAARLRRMAYLMCGDWHHAEDVVQQAYVRLYVAWPRLKRDGSLNAYARRTVLSVVRDDGRRPWRRRERVSERLPEALTVDAHAAVDVRLSLAHHLQQLPQRQRAVVILRYIEDLSVVQTAALLRIEPGTVKSQASRGLATLRELLEPSGLLADPEFPAHERTAP